MQNILLETTLYVINAPYFYSLIGMTIASAMFVGATLYNGELKQATKGIVTVGSYSGFLLLMFSARITESIRMYGIVAGREYQVWAGVETIIMSTLAYVIGLLLGVYVSKKAREKARAERRQNDREKQNS